ncbi:hypothetical protein DMN91_004154 [Ooceraea biroi]|uniref:Uncharacterized protein n=1 Tax=Ooceraea biroi TaxID=2015173 RepID=A0A3L8DUJ4_OOCBI|nr:uncharacterized protein LOC113561759 [Ooceraea biroi]RLU23946.1 hypothetical protein DMN91_004154 [Ooceraea biroi]
MSKKQVSIKHGHFTCSANAEYDEVIHKIDDNILSIKLPKDKRRVQTVDTDERVAKPAPIIDVNCFDKYGNKCKKGCPKVNVMHNQIPPPKKPEEEMLLLRTMREITPADDMKHILEVEFKLPRNYIPLPEPGPPPSIIIPKELVEKKTKD